MSATATAKAKGRNGYRRPYKDLAEFYEVSLRTVKTWAAEGKASGEICPLDDPEEFRRWWSRHHSSRACPAGVLKHLAAAPELPVVEVEELGNLETGAAGALARLEEMEIFLATKAREPGQVKDWLAALARLQMATTKFREEEEKAARLVPRDLVAEVLRDFHGPIEQGVRGLFATMCGSTGFPTTPAAEEAWGKSCDSLFENFGKELFSAA